MTTWILLPVLFLLAALLYSSVGHAGASGYLAIMALLGMEPAVMKPTALALNILVATIASIKFYGAGHFSWSKFWPFAATSVPFAFVGGYISLPSYLYKPIVALVLFFAAYRLFRVSQAAEVSNPKPIPVLAGLACGAVIGLISGLTGVGGGIFLTPLLLFMSWAETRNAAGVSAVFILVNSISGLTGNLSSLGKLPPAILVWGIAAAVGGFIGAEFGSKHFGGVVLRRILVVVLVIAGLKMLLT